MKADKIWINGEMIDFNEAKIHVLSHVVHYGSGWFEGIRAYETDRGPAIFRFDEHVERLIDSCKIYKTEIPYSKDKIKQAIIDTIKINKLNSAYIRPLAYRGFKTLGVNPYNCPVDLMIATWEWGAYLGEEGLEKGISCMTSSWRRLAPDTLPTMAKASGNYLGSQLIKMEAIDNGYDEGIAMDYHGNISEGSGENIFVIKGGKVYTPPMSASALYGITRNTVMEILKDLGIEVIEQNIPREFLYTADEIFLTGTAAEVTPVATVDKCKVGIGKRGEITTKVQKIYFDVVNGKHQMDENWLTYVNEY